MTGMEPLRVIVMRRLPFPAEHVFDAWLDPRIARRFLFATETGEMVRAETDPRVGGGFTFVDRRDGVDVEHIGTYLELNRPRRLVFTFLVRSHSTEATIVEIDIVRDGDGCVLTLRQDMAPEHADYKERSERGWSMIIANLDKALVAGE